MKTQHFLLMMSFMLLCSSIFIMNAKSAEYDETYLNDFIDGDRDNFYSNYENGIYFGYSSNRYAFFIEFNQNITSIQINGTIITGNISSQEIVSFIQLNIAEIAIERSFFGENVCFEIKINNNDPIIIDPFGALEPKEEQETDEIEDDKKVTWDLVKFFGGIFTNWVFYLCCSLLIIFIADYNNHPVVKIESLSGQKVRLGRFILETDEPKINKKKFLFLNSNGVQEVYCTHTFRALDQFCFQRVYVIEWDYPHILMTKLKLPEGSGLKTKEIIKNWKNRILWVFFIIFRFTPFRWFALGIYNKLQFKETNVKEVDYLIPWICMDSIEYRFDITYSQDELNPEKNCYETVEKEQKNVLYADILNLQKTAIKDLHITLKNVDKIQYPTLKEAQEDKRSRFELMNKHENDKTAMELSIFDLEDRLNSSYTTNRNLKLEMGQKVRDGLKPMEESNEFLRNNFPNMLANALSFRNMGVSEEQSIERAILEQLNKNDSEKKKLEQEIAKMQAKLEKKEKKSPFNPNEIKITEEKSDDNE